MIDPNFILTGNKEHERYCPKCGSDQIENFTEGDVIGGLGMYVIFEIPRGLAAFESGFHCRICGHWWSSN